MIKKDRLSLGREVWLLAIILFFVEFVRGAALISFIPIYGKEVLYINVAIIGVAITAHYLTDTILKSVIGYLLDRFSIRFIVHTGLLITLAGMLMFQFANHHWVFILASALYGVGISPIWIVCLTKVTEEKRATQMGFLYTIWLVGMGLGPVVCNVIIEHHPILSYWILVVLSLLAWILSLFITNTQVQQVQYIPFREQLHILSERLKLMKPLLPGMILQTTGASMIVPILPSFAEESLRLTNTSYTLLLLFGGACTVIALIPMGKLSDRFGKKWFLVFGFLMFAFALYSISQGPTLVMAYVWAIVLGVSYAAVLPAWNALLANYVPPAQQGLGWGIFSTVEGIGVMIGPVLGGYLASIYSTQQVVFISSILFGAIALFYIFFPFKHIVHHSTGRH
ncbi:MFS transporter [Paenibacillus selenitireducens]|uniref:MFS transporter n=1 Tax=Paenibacillus selenitireducens TaxID=1324314 RepID=UPI000997BA5C|nr:MFS transporter [Paenibacillus selenitireducens]